MSQPYTLKNIFESLSQVHDYVVSRRPPEGSKVGDSIETGRVLTGFRANLELLAKFIKENPGAAEIDLVAEESPQIPQDQKPL